MFKERPHIKIPKTRTDQAIDLVTLFFFCSLLFLAYHAYNRLPERIPIHFSWKGEADSFGSKKSLFALPIIGIFIYFVLGFLIGRPHIFNYPVSITKQNAGAMYAKGLMSMRVIRLWALVILNIVMLAIVKSALNNFEPFGKWLIPTILISAILLVIFCVRQFFTTTRNSENVI